MKTVNFCLATHNHQPIGNFDSVFEEAYQKSYLPFFTLAEKFSVRFATHFSGILLEWLIKNHPEQIALLRRLVENGQLEIISGAYFESILSVFSQRDGLAQIAKLSSGIEKTFGVKPHGMWLAERIWEPQLPSLMSDANIHYTILDDTHFRGAGLEDTALTGSYLTEDQGKSIAVFPISKALRYTIPFAEVDETIKILRDAATEGGDNIITFADDGEKFGVWPNTFKHVYSDGWLEEFFRKLDENSSWLKTIHFIDALKTIPPKGKIYLPTGSYAEMMEWSLPTKKAILNYESFISQLSANKEEWKEYQQFVRGGFWRNFFVKYPESNHLHKRVLRASERFAALPPSVKKTVPFRKAYDHLLEAQCNDPYWHGVFGGIYLPNLRHEVYSSLITAENELSKLEKKRKHTIEDPVFENTSLRITLDPSRGGSISEIDYKPKAFNLSNFINRVDEPSHEKLKSAQETGNSGGESKSIHEQVLTKEKGLDKYLIADWYRHGAFIEHFLSADAKITDLARMTFLEHGDFFKSHIEPTIKKNRQSISLEFLHHGNIFSNGSSHPLTVRKSLLLDKDAPKISAHIALENNSEIALPIKFASEWTFGLLSGDAHDRYYESPGIKIANKKLNSTGIIENSLELSLVDEWSGFKVALEVKKQCTFWRTPIETVSLSEEGFERVYQGSIIFALWDFSLQPGETWGVYLDISVTPL